MNTVKNMLGIASVLYPKDLTFDRLPEFVNQVQKMHHHLQFITFSLDWPAHRQAHFICQKNQVTQQAHTPSLN